MSEPSETGGRPLDPTTNQLQHLQGSTTSPPTSLHIDHYKSSPTHNQPRGSKKNSPRRRPGNTQPEPPTPHIGSSRSEQPSTASPTDMASNMSPVHYTKTGRISKAKKGLKVHRCDTCGKSYTRAEHLRRHKKNHTPDDALHCEVPGCDKVFHRMDLLIRHQERHNEVGDDSRRQSIAGSPVSLTVSTPALEPSMMSATPALPAHPYYQPVSPMHESAPPARYNHAQFRTPRTPQAFSSSFSHVPRSSPQSIFSPNQSKHRSFQFNRQLGSALVPVDPGVPGLWPEPYSPTPGYSSSSGYVSPIAPTDFPVYTPYHRTRTPSNASCVDQPVWSFASRSPASTTSTMAFTWPSADKGHTASGLAYMHTSCPMTSMSIATSFDAMSEFGHFGPKSMAQRDEEERTILFGDQQYGMASNDNTYPFEQCLDCYWRLFHPTFPVVHRSTPVSSSPMLHAAMAAIGGQYSPDTKVKKQSRDLHDRCVKVLELRDHETMTEPDRLCDFQAIFLLEVMSQYRARRAGKVLSSRFDRVYHKAAEDCRRTTQLLADIVSSLEKLREPASDRWYQWIELASWQRLLLSCYILESQQPLLLARKPLSSLVQDVAFDLPFPGHTSLWDATDSTSWVAAARQHSYSPTYVYEVTPESTSVSFDTFQSAVLLAAHYKYPENLSSYISSPTISNIGHLLATTPVSMRMLATAKLVQVTPLRALLAVSGESWILSEKVETPQIFTALKTSLRTWVAQLWSTPASEGVPVKEAVRLSVEILQQALQEQRLGVVPEMGTDMGIFFAALVLWVVTTAATTRMKNLPSESTAMQQSRARSQSLTRHGSVQQSSLLSSPNAPQSPIIEATPENPILSHAQIIINTISFLSNAQFIVASSNAASSSASDLARQQTGCVSLLLWVKLRLRGVSLEEQSGAAAESWAAKPGGLGELLDGVTGSLERILRGGWSGWGV